MKMASRKITEDLPIDFCIICEGLETRIELYPCRIMFSADCLQSDLDGELTVGVDFGILAENAGVENLEKTLEDTPLDVINCLGVACHQVRLNVVHS